MQNSKVELVRMYTCVYVHIRDIYWHTMPHINYDISSEAKTIAQLLKTSHT